MNAVTKSIGYAALGCAALASAAFWVTFPDRIRAVSADELPGAHHGAQVAHWHVGHIDGGCFAYSPAEFLARYKGDPNKPSVRETRDDSGALAVVEITSRGGLYSSTRTFYRTKAACDAAIAKATHIPDEYR